MGTLSGIAFTSITPFTPITPEGGGWGEGSNGVELVCFSSPSERADCLRCFALSLFFGGATHQTRDWSAESDDGV